MKTTTTIIAAALVSAVCAGFSACNEPKDNNGKEAVEVPGIQTVAVSNEVAAFFNRNVELIGVTLASNGDFGFDPYADFRIGNEHKRNTEEWLVFGGCVAINSADELPQAGHEGAELRYPHIDFESHTLIVGVFMNYGGECVLAQGLTAEPSAVLDIVVGICPGDNFHAHYVRPSYFWGIYPKIDAKNIELKIDRK